MTTRGDLRDLTVAALKGQTGAGARVYTPADWPTVVDEYPVILVRAPRERLESWSRSGGPSFTSTATMLIIGKTQSLAQTNDFGAEVAELAAERLERQILVAVINNPALMGQLQQFSEIRSETDVNADGETHIAELKLEIDMEYPVGVEDFYPDTSLRLAGADITLTGPQGETLAGLDLTFPQS
jgi:hypothetical protein